MQAIISFKDDEGTNLQDNFSFQCASLELGTGYTWTLQKWTLSFFPVEEIDVKLNWFVPSNH